MTTLAPHDALIAAYLSGRKPGTVRGYTRDLAILGGFLNVGERPADVARAVLENGQGEANRLILSWRNAMIEGGVAPRTINRRLAAVRSLVKLARLTGIVPWAVDVPGVKIHPYVDTTVPTWERFVLACETASVRDRALLRLMGHTGLRRGEVVSLNVSDIAADCAWLRVLRKGGLSPSVELLSQQTSNAVGSWRDLRGPGGGDALFPGSGCERLSVETLRRLTQRTLGCSPHSLRRMSADRAKAVTNGNVRDIQLHMRHENVQTTAGYLRRDADAAGEVRRLMGGG